MTTPRPVAVRTLLFTALLAVAVMSTSTAAPARAADSGDGLPPCVDAALIEAQAKAFQSLVFVEISQHPAPSPEFSGAIRAARRNLRETLRALELAVQAAQDACPLD